MNVPMLPVTDQGSPDEPVSAETGMRSRMRGRAGLLIQEGGLAATLVICIIIFSATAPNFTSPNNIENILRQCAFTGIIATGMTLVIISGEIDISVGSAVSLASGLMGVLYTRNWAIGLIILTVLLVGVAFGALAGMLRALYNVPSFITTLALFLAMRGLSEVITNTRTIPINSELLDRLNENVLGVPFPVLIVLICLLLSWWVARRTTYGRSVFALGGNAAAARLAGLPVTRIRIVLFATTGLLAAITGILSTARIGAGTSVIGNGLEFDVIAAVIIGGTSLAGGRGSIIGTMIGVLFVQVLANALVLYGVGSSAQDVVRGGVVLVAVLLSNFQTGIARQKT